MTVNKGVNRTHDIVRRGMYEGWISDQCVTA